MMLHAVRFWSTEEALRIFFEPLGAPDRTKVVGRTPVPDFACGFLWIDRHAADRILRLGRGCGRGSRQTGDRGFESG